ncbi:MAG: methyltransferase domain-containing protein, partial [Conexivisphaera sp.]
MPRPYQPSEDSLFLLECVEGLAAGTAGRALEIGCGTGFVTRGLRDSGALRLAACADLFPEAAREASGRFRGSPLEAVVCDAARPFREDAFDLIYFNPPYLPCDRDEDPAVCGGRGGVEVALEFLRSAAGALRRGGRMVALVRAEGAGEVLGEARTM